MARAQREAERVRQTLSRWDGNGRVPPQAEQVADDFAAVVEEVNGRLHRCVGLLRQGLTTEAIHEAEIAPPVLEEAAALSFPSRHDWLAVCETHDLTIPPEIDEHLAEEIDDAFGREVELEPLLRRHRLLALARAPLKRRLHVLRKLAEVEPSNPVWPEDIQRFEAARFREIGEASKAAFEARDRRLLQALRDELSEPSLTAPPASLVMGLDSLSASAEAEHASKRLPEMRGPLADACDAGDVQTVRTMLRRWDRYMGHLQEPPSAELVEVGARARALVGEADAEAETAQKFAASVAAVERGLDEEAAWDEMERRWAQVARFDREVPSVVRRRYEAYAERHRLQAARRFRLMLVGAMASAAVLAVLIGLIVWSQIRGRELDAWEGRIASAVNEQRWEDARSLLVELEADKPSFREKPEIEALALRIRQRDDAIAARLAGFTTAIERAEQAPVEKPDRDSLDDARQLAESEEERRRVAAVEEKIEAYRDERRAVARAEEEARDDAFSQQLSKARDRWASLQQAEDVSGSVAGLDALAADLAKLRDQPASDVLKGAAEALHTSVVKRRDRLVAHREEQEAVAEALAAAKPLHASPQRLAEALTSFVEDHPEHRLAREFERAAAVAKHASVLSEWTRLAETAWAWSPGSADEATRAAALFENLRAAHPLLPFEVDLDAHLKVLSLAEVGLDPLRGPFSASSGVRTMLDHPLIAGVYAIRAKDGTTYYQPESIPMKDWGSGRKLIRFARDGDQLTGTDPLESVVVDASSFGRNAESVLAPQSAFARSANAWLDRHEGEWQSCHTHLLGMLLDQQEMDPLVKKMLAEGLAGLAMQFDDIDADALAGWRRRLAAIDVPANWMDPAAVPRLKATRDRVKQVLAGVPDLDALAERRRKQREAAIASLPRFTPVALVWIDADGERSLSVPLDKLPRGRLVGLSLDATGERPLLVPIADLSGDTPEVSEAASRLPAGTLVYHQR